MGVSLLCLVGIPGSGKTTLARELQKYVECRKGFVDLIEYDSVICGSVYARGEWKDSRINLLRRIENLAVNRLGQTENNTVVILDDNFFYRSMRYDVYKVARKLRLGFLQVFLDVPLEVCMFRNKLKASPLDRETIVKIATLIEPPEPSKNSWEEDSVCCFGDESDFETIYRLLSKTWDHPCFKNSPVCQPPQLNSDLHYADLALRQIVSTSIQSAPPDRRPELTRNLSLKKKHVLEDIKMMNIILPRSSGSDSVPIFAAFLEPFMLEHSSVDSVT